MFHIEIKIQFYLNPQAFLEGFKVCRTLEPSQWTQELDSSEKWFRYFMKTLNRMFGDPPEYN